MPRQWNNQDNINTWVTNQGVVSAPDGTIYLVDINETHYWGSFYGWGQKHSSEQIEKPVHAE